MSDAVETLHRLCACLRAREAGARRGAADLPGNRDDWRAVIDLANAHYLTPALWVALEGKGEAGRLPPDARAFLREACSLNRARNARIRGQAVELVRALDEAGIASVILKGGVHLFEGDEAAFGARMMADLDVLVPEARLDESFAIARDLGYGVMHEIDPRLHHLDIIGRAGDIASVEIHKDAGMQRLILPAEEVFRRAIPVRHEGARILVPCPTHRAIHGIFHSEVQAQNNYALGHMPLRYLHDLMLLRTRHESEIDWAEVERALARQGYGHLAAGFVYLGHRLLGQPMPDALAATPAARRHYRWCLAQLRWPALRAVVSVVGTAAHPFRRPPVEYIYGERPNLTGRQANRLRYLRDLALQYRGRSLAKLSSVFSRMFRA